MANSNDSAVIRVEENGIEYFTVVATGESGVSEIGASRLTEIPQQTLSRWLKNLTQNKPVKGLEHLCGKRLYLTQKPSKRGGKVKIIKAEFVYELLEFAAFERGSKVARQILKASGVIGLTSFIQGKTGWLPKRYQSSSSSRQLIDYILNEPKQWNLHFNSVWQREACRATGWNWQSRAMANLIANYIYKPLGKDVYERLLDINRDRKSRHHQFFDATADEVILKEHIQQVGGLLRVSRSYPHFKQLFADAFGDGIQLAILG